MGLKKVIVTERQVDTLRDLLSDYRKEVASGAISGFHHPAAQELADADELLAILDEAPDADRGDEYE